MALSPELNHLIEISAPLWAGEAEVVRTYWNSPVRTVDTDLLWLRRQCSKEFNGSGLGEFGNLGVFMGPLTELREVFPNIDTGTADSVPRAHVQDLIESLSEEFEHFCLFADAHDRISPPGTPPLNPHRIEPWDQDVALTALRHAHIEAHGELGKRACRFTEGGYCTLFREGMRLKGHGGRFAEANELIAAACGGIYEDEFGHMLEGIAGLDREGWSGADFALMENLVAEQLHQRIRMRNEEFSFPLSEARVQAIYAGDIAPEPFDVEAAEARLAAREAA